MNNFLNLTGFTLALVLVANPAFSQTQAPTTATEQADALFEQAQGLLQAGKYAEACPKFEESRNLAPGLGVTMYLADCLERTGSLVRALALFKEAEVVAIERKDQRAALARAKISELEVSAAKLQIHLRDTAPDLEFWLDGEPLPRAQIASLVFLDPGTHRFEAKAPGKQTFQRNFEAVRSSHITLEVPVLAAASAARSTVNLNADQPSSRKTWAYVAAGGGALGIGLGTFFGLSAKSSLDQSNDKDNPERCEPNNECGPRGIQLRNEAISSGTLSTVSFALGAALLGGGVYLYLSDSPNSETAVSLSPTFGKSEWRLSARARF